MQDYHNSDKLNDEGKGMISEIRTKCVKGVRQYLTGMYRVCMHCHISCKSLEPQVDTQEDVLACEEIGG